MRIFVINPGSTSTKFAIYENSEQIWCGVASHSAEDLEHFHHPNEQLQYRIDAMYDIINKNGIAMNFDGVVARGGLLQPTPGGVYEVDDLIKHDLINARLEHVCNLGALMAEDLALKTNARAFIADPEVVDEFMPEARFSGIKEIKRKSIFHALNSKAVSHRYAKEIGRSYDDLNLIVVHLGGGISVGAHRKGKVVDVNNALNGDGPFSPERAGTIPADQLAELCFSGKYSLREIKKMLNGKGGLSSLLGSNDVKTIASKAETGEEPYKSVLDSMIYSVAREVGARAVALRGEIDAIIITGGIAHSKYCVDKLCDWIGFLGPVILKPGEDELTSLAENAYGALTGELPIIKYNPENILEPASTVC